MATDSKQQERNAMVLNRLINLSFQDEDFAEALAGDLQTFLSEIRGQDGFGTEGQCDPRGDQRDQEFSMLHVQGVDTEALEDLQNNEAEQLTGLTFGAALEELKQSKKVARGGWNGKGMWIRIIPAGNASFRGCSMQDCIGMKTAAGLMQPGWLASQADMLANDWVVVD